MATAHQFTTEAPDLKVGEYVKHPAHKREVLITQIDDGMVAFTVTAPFGGQFRAWATDCSFARGFGL